ncbi:MAG TPA: T9SS type A sorting domain-containing protein, partial [Flavobacteriales bacterium]|nr:T9SS type A sorting domain-containing protein [Flavobacteriales bacterium]
RAITANETTGDIYVGGQYATNSPVRNNAFILKYTPTTTAGTSNALNTAIWSILGDNTYPGYDKINDLDFDEQTNKVYGIGQFQSGMKFNPGLSVLSTTSTDAFICGYNDLGGSCSQIFLSKGNISGAEMIGEGIAVDEQNNMVYVTGTYKGSASNPFSLGAAALPSVSNYAAFMIGKNYNTSAAWSKNAYVSLSSGNTYGKEVSCVNNRVFFVGEFSRNTVAIQGITGTYNFFGANSIGPENFHVFTATYNSSGTGLVANVTRSVLATDVDFHSAKSITVDEYNHCYIVGQYDVKMSYLNPGTPPSANLIRTGVGANAYIMRAKQNTGEFKLAEAESDQEDLDGTISGGLKVFPSPTNGHVTIEIENFHNETEKFKLILFNSTGQQLQTINITSQKTILDLSPHENGIYLISFSDGTSNVVTRISKAN